MMPVRASTFLIIAVALITSLCATCDNDPLADGLPGEINCSSCHGSGDNPAPDVGAHKAHTGKSVWHAQIGCTECHLVPKAVDDKGHMDTPAPAEIKWGSLASSDSASPEYDFKSGLCTNVYCHGSTLGGSGAEPAWEDTGTAQCGSCHMIPPGQGHPSSDNCGACHGCVAENAQIRKDNAYLHINGEVNMQMPDSCPDR